MIACVAKRWNWPTVAVAFLVMVCAITCSPKETAAPQESESVRETVPVKKVFAIGFNQWVGFAPFYLAKERGYYGDLDVSLNFIDLEGDKRAGLYSGRLDMICETMDMFQTNRDGAQYPGVIVFAVDESLGGDGVIASAGVKSLADLKGKAIASEPGLPAHFVLQYLLDKDGMTLKDIEVHDMTSADAASAFMAGRVEVAGTYEPYLSTALSKREGSHLLVSTKDLPGLIVDVAIVRKETLEKWKTDVRTVFNGWCKAMEELEKRPNEAVAVMAKAFNMNPQEFNDTRSGLRYFNYDDNVKLFGTSTDPGSVVETFDLAGQILLKNGLTAATVSASDKIEFSIVAARLQ